MQRGQELGQNLRCNQRGIVLSLITNMKPTADYGGGTTCAQL